MIRINEPTGIPTFIQVNVSSVAICPHKCRQTGPQASRQNQTLDRKNLFKTSPPGDLLGSPTLGRGCAPAKSGAASHSDHHPGLFQRGAPRSHPAAAGIGAFAHSALRREQTLAPTLCNGSHPSRSNLTVTFSLRFPLFLLQGDLVILYP